MYRILEVLNKENDFIQAELYKNSLKISKEHRPNLILFIDRDGIPLVFNINARNTNEQITLTPLEKTIMKDFELSKFVVCTDGRLSSNDNRKFNNKDYRAFITTQSIKKLKKYLKEWDLCKEN